MFLYASEPLIYYFQNNFPECEIERNQNPDVFWRNILVVNPFKNPNYVIIEIRVWVPRGGISESSFLSYAKLKPGEFTQVFYLDKISLYSKVGSNQNPGIGIYQIFANAHF